MRSNRQAVFWDATRQILPVTLGTSLWGVVTGLALVNSGLTVVQAVAASVLLYSGTAMLVALPLMQSGASLLVILGLALVTCLHFFVYAAAISPDLRRLPWARRLGFGYLATDTGLTVYFAKRRLGLLRTGRVAFFLGACVPVYATWVLGCLFGVAVAGLLPSSPRWSFLAVLAMLTVLVSQTKGRAMYAAALAGGTVALLAKGMPYRLGAFAAIICGIVVALRVDGADGKGGASGPAKVSGAGQ